MTPQRWQQVKGILADALECEKPDERAAVVERACAGDLFLKQEVNALLVYADHVVVADELLTRMPDTPKVERRRNAL